MTTRKHPPAANQGAPASGRRSGQAAPGPGRKPLVAPLLSTQLLGGSPTQIRNRRRILEAALEVFSTAGFNGGTIDRIAEVAALSKPNILYYFPSKEAIHVELLSALLAAWMKPLAEIDPAGDPLEEVLAYVRRKLEMSRLMPRESRLFASEIFHGAPRLQGVLKGELKELVDDKAALLGRWMAEGHLAQVDPRHLLFSVWALTQHYADFETQVRAVLGPGTDPFAGADPFLQTLFRRLLAV